jgi:hypothetical protein
MTEPILKTVDILTIFALIVGPIMAVQVQKLIDRTKEKKGRRLWVFKTLMATRHATLSIDHVSALNRIDLEFPDNRAFHKVIEAWKMYFDNLSAAPKSEHDLSVWVAKNDDLLAELLYQMGKSLNFKFDRSLIKRNVYSPRGHAKIEYENNAIREKLIEVFEGKRTLPIDVQVVAWNEELTKKQSVLQDKQSQLWDLMIEHYTRENEKARQK